MGDAYVGVFVMCTCLYCEECVHIYTHTQRLLTNHTHTLSLCSIVHMYVYVCMYACVCLYVYMYVCMYVCMYIYVCMCVCVCVHVCFVMLLRWQVDHSHSQPQSQSHSLTHS